MSKPRRAISRSHKKSPPRPASAKTVPALVGKSELARLVGVNPSDITRRINDQALPINAAGKIGVHDLVRWAWARMAAGGDSEDLKVQLIEAQIANKRSDTSLKNLQHDIKTGKFIPFSDHEKTVEEFARLFVGGLDRMIEALPQLISHPATDAVAEGEKISNEIREEMALEIRKRS